MSLREEILTYLANQPQPADHTIPTVDCTPVFQRDWASGAVRMLSNPVPPHALVDLAVLDEPVNRDVIGFDGECLTMPGRALGERVRYRPVVVDDARRLLVCDLAEIVTVGDDPTPPVAAGGLPVEWATR